MSDDPERFTFEGHPAEVDQARAEALDRVRAASSFIVLTRDETTGESKVLGGTVAGPVELAVLGWVGLREVYVIGRRAAELIPDPLVRLNARPRTSTATRRRLRRSRPERALAALSRP